jgi:hypothetical protein
MRERETEHLHRERKREIEEIQMEGLKLKRGFSVIQSAITDDFQNKNTVGIEILFNLIFLDYD